MQRDYRVGIKYDGMRELTISANGDDILIYDGEQYKTLSRYQAQCLISALQDSIRDLDREEKERYIARLSDANYRT